MREKYKFESFTRIFIKIQLLKKLREKNYFPYSWLLLERQNRIEILEIPFSSESHRALQELQLFRINFVR